VLVRRTEFGADVQSQLPITLTLDEKAGEQIEVSPKVGNQVVAAEERAPTSTFLKVGAEQLFPIGWYDMPAKDEELREMSQAGINLIRCVDRAALDRVHSVGMLGWMPLAVQQGATSELRQQIEAVVDHPALAVWEGPDEIVWNFTAYSGLAKSAGITKDDWYAQRPNAVKYAESEASKILPKLRDGILLVKSLDKQNRPFWMNEAAESDARYVRRYADVVDAIGCDYYPVRQGDFDLRSIGKMVDRWQAVGHGKPVWMVLQAFSWHPMVPERGRRYPDFTESRYMAYTAIARGAQGILYWGAENIDDPDFRQSLYALTSELAALQPFLVVPNLANVRAEVILDLSEPRSNDLRAVGRRVGDELLVIIVNEGPHPHLGVVVNGLANWDGQKLQELYGVDEPTVDHGDITVRLQPFEVKLYSTTRRWESSRRTGRDYISPREQK
jgi:hypothetical protein